MPNFGTTEHDILALFPVRTSFFYEGEKYTVELSGKPKPSSGECKTDTYIRALDSKGNKREFKLSVKQNNAEFLENKMSLQRAKEIFGEEAQTIIGSCIKSVIDYFSRDYLVYLSKTGHTEAKSIKLGWKFELLKNDGGKKSGMIHLTLEQKLNVYAGTNLSREKRDCYVMGELIKDSGVANMIVVVDPGNYNINSVISSMMPIDSYVKKNDSDLYFACKALNYRAVPDKWDGDRPLAVYVDWTLDNGIINAKLVTDNPLVVCGNTVGNKLKTILETLNISSRNFSEIKRYLNKTIKVFE